MKKINFKKTMSIILALAIMLSVLVPALSIFAGAATTNIITDESKSVVITDYTISNSSGDVNKIVKGDKITIKLNVIDNRALYPTSDTMDTTQIKARLTGENFTGATEGTVNSIDAVGVSGTDKIVGYTVTFMDVTYQGISKDFTFETTCLGGTGGSPVLQYKSVSQSISQAVENSVQIEDDHFKIDSTKTAFVSNYVVLDLAGNELSTVNPGEKVMIAVSVVDNRVTYKGNPPKEIRARLSQGSFISSSAENTSYDIRDVGEENGRKILSYAVVFRDVVYQGGTPEISFDVSYPDQNNVPLAVPYTLIKQTITQAVDDIPEPKVILNSANYGGVATIGKNFTLSTVATNTSEHVALENVSVRVELPTGIAMASGNSQVLIGSVAKKGQISHGFNLIVSGVENNITSLPIKIFYDFEAYVKGARKTYTTEQEVAINIEQETKFDISKLEYMETINAGEENGITVSLVNKGKTTVNNVTVEIQSTKINGPQTTFVGNIQPGSEGTADIYFTINEEGSASGKIIVTYEDAKGKSATVEKEFKLEVMAPMMPPDWDQPTDIPMPEEKKSFLPWIIAAVVVAAAGGGAFVVIKKRKAEKETEDDDEDI